MVNGNDVLEFEEENAQDLMEGFIHLHEKEYQEFVMEEFNNRGGE